MRTGRRIEARRRTQVSAEGDLEAAAEADTVRRGDDGHRYAAPQVAHVLREVAHLALGPVEKLVHILLRDERVARNGLDVEAGAKGASLAVQHDRAHARAVGDQLARGRLD